jgi:uncharacterized membrane protein YidH (DUF202 family)
MKRASLALLSAGVVFMTAFPFLVFAMGSVLPMGRGKLALASALATALLASVSIAALLWPQERAPLTDEDPAAEQ